MKHAMKRLFLFAAFVAVSACTPVEALNLVAEGTGGYQLTENVAYGKREVRKMDVYRPKAEGKKPVVMFVHGGSWQFGKKEDYRFVGQALADAGFVVMIPDYQKAPAKFPSFVVDVAEAITFAKKNAAKFGGDANRLFLMGHSAGAYNVMMALTYPGVEEKLQKNKIAGVVGLAGPYDFLPLTDPALVEIFGGANNFDTQPIMHVKKGLPPMLLITGKEDDVVAAKNTTNYAAELKAKGNKAEVLVLDDVSHLGIMGAFSPLLRNDAVWQPIIEFLQKAPR